MNYPKTPRFSSQSPISGLGPRCPLLFSVLSLLFVQSVLLANQTDYFLTGGAPVVSPFGLELETASNIGFDYVSIPPVIMPGQQVPVDVQYRFVNPNNANAVIYLNVFGDWQPGSELARLENGTLVGGSRTTYKTFSFQAPSTPGTYRIRIPFVEAFAPVTNFFGGPALGGNSPGIGDYVEVSFAVKTPPVTDYFLANGPPFISPFGLELETASNIGFDYVSIPPVIMPGQQVPVDVQYRFVNPNNANAVIYLNVFGDWQPGSELARLENGTLVGGSRTTYKTFSFQAPSTPGTYRIRIPFVEAFAPVTNFFGGPALGGNSPGIGHYAEVLFTVQSPPVMDYFLSLVNGAPYLSPFGLELETDSNLGFDYISVPPVVLPGQQVPVDLQYRFVNPGNDNAAIYLNAFGDWQPGTQLASLENGSVGGSRTTYKSFSFQAPSTPGIYRLRFPFVEAFAPVTNFYGGPLGGPSSPGIGHFAERSFTVSFPWPTITQQPVSQTVSPGQTVSFCVTALGTQPFTYQWQLYGTNIVGATNGCLTFPGASPSQAGPYRVIITDVAGSSTSSTATLSFLDLRLYAGLTIYGSVGANYRVDYATALQPTNWQTFTTITLPSSPYLFFDSSTPATGNRFFRAVLLP